MRPVGTLKATNPEGKRYEAQLVGTNCPCMEGIRVRHAPNELSFIRGKGISVATDMLKKAGWRWQMHYA